MESESTVKAETSAKGAEVQRKISNGEPTPAQDAATAQNTTAEGQFPPPKTDKPRPHVCGTCGRSFARLEHLKRHERSHTKEKPFECPECTRCFARRDLLLRHQQKLHMTNTTSSRPRAARRESASAASVSNAKVRKNSMAMSTTGGATGPGMLGHRPRANTIGHIDLSSLGLLDNPNIGRVNALGLSAVGMSGLPGPMNYDYRGMSSSLGHHGNSGLPKLDTQAINNGDISNSLRTAPPYATFGGFDIDQLFGPGTTINPAQLHFGGAASAIQPSLPPLEPFTMHPAIDSQAQVDDYGWMRDWNMQLSHDNNEQAIEESSPSRISSGDSPGDCSEIMNSGHSGLNVQTPFAWPQQGTLAHRISITNEPLQLDSLGFGLPNMDQLSHTISPNTLHDSTPTADPFFHQAMLQQQRQHAIQHDPVQVHHHNYVSPSLSGFNSDSPSISSSSARQSSITSFSTDSITDLTRQALLSSLAQPSVFGHNHRKYSQPTISSPLSPGAARGSLQGPSLPATSDIRRYVEAFIQFAHPHLPVLHIATLTFDCAEYTHGARATSPRIGTSAHGVNSGSGCLILGMAAIGALYEYDHVASKELFDAAKKLISLYLEERRRADMASTGNSATASVDGSQHTPLWLVQAMLLSVIYGHQCGDKTAADVASNQCAALVTLARAAGLTEPSAGDSSRAGRPKNGPPMTADVDMRDPSIAPEESSSRHHSADPDLQSQWLIWKTAEERKRSLFAIFIMSSLLTTAYNHTPTIMNSEILLDLPCDEALYAADTAQEWQTRGGLQAAQQSTVSFASALSTLLTANLRQEHDYVSTAYNSNNPLGALQGSDAFADNDLRPSTLGCLVLINALHNYIWETRNRHNGRQWTPQETESMFTHIEPALNAWQAAWKSNEDHKLERPNPFGMGPLPADSIPLLDLAFLRLFVNLGRSKEAFWQRDFDAMADELARGSEIVQHAEAPASDQDVFSKSETSTGRKTSTSQRRQSQSSQPKQSSSRRERHLRKAAFYAADSLTIACSYNLTYADLSAHELPVQSAMCFFDCSQVLAEWACTVQERVGRFLGVLGRDQVDYTQVPAIMTLETEDVELLRKIESICESLEAKRIHQENLLSLDMQNLSPSAGLHAMHNNANLGACGYGSKILRITAMMLEKAVVWPGKHGHV